MRFGKLKLQLKADHVERLAEISVKGDSNNNNTNDNSNNNNNIVAYIKLEVARTKSQGKASQVKLELGPRPESKLEISLGRSPKAEILKHNNRHGRQRTARGEEGKGAARRLILAQDKQLDARLLKLCNFSASNCRQRHFLLWFGFHLSTLPPHPTPLYPWLTMQMSWLQAGGWIGLPGTPTLTLIAIVCGISTCLYRSQRPGLLLLLLPHLICHAPTPFPFTPCCWHLSLLLLWLGPALAVLVQKAFCQHGSTSTTSFAFLALCLLPLATA